MPRPPILPVPDRRAIFDSGRTFSEWLAQPDEPAQADRIRENLASIVLDDATRAALNAIDRRVNVIAIAETWCGDVILHTPLLVRMVEANTRHLDLRFVSREQYPEFFARFLTNGGEAIPKFVFCNHTFTEVGNWGPMPSTPRQWIAQGKACDDVKTARRKVSEFYQADNHRESTAELLALFQTAAFKGFAD